MIALISDRYLDAEKLGAQVSALKSLPSIEKIGLISSNASLAKKWGLELINPSDANSLARLARNQKIILKLNDHEVMENALIQRHLDAHFRNDKPLTVFCPGPNNFNHSPVVLVEVYQPDRMPHASLLDSLGGSVRTLISTKGKEFVKRAGHKIPYPLYKKIRASYYEKFELGSEGEDIPLMPRLKLFDASIPRERIDVFTGGAEDKMHYAVDRIAEFFPFPQSIHYVLTNVCNLRCVMCPYHSETARSMRRNDFFAQPTFTNVEKFREVAREAGKFGVGIRMGQLEEALLHRNIGDLVQIAHDSGVPEIHLTTNGTLMNPKVSERLLDAGITSVMVSADACTEHTYSQIRLGGDFGDVVRNTEELIRLRNRKGTQTKLSVSMILQGAAIAEKDQFLRFWRDKGIDEVTVYQLSEYDAEGKIIRKDENYDYNKKGRYACAAPWLETFVYPAGEVSMCCYTLELVPTKGILSVGNLNEKPLSQIWLDEPYQHLRRQLIKNRFESGVGTEACLDCQIWSGSTHYRKRLPNKENVIFNETMATYQFP